LGGLDRRGDAAQGLGKDPRDHDRRGLHDRHGERILQPIVVGPKVRNVPKEGYYAWDPGGYIGLYKPDTFWLSQ
jgi:hypothetical protein